MLLSPSRFHAIRSRACQHSSESATPYCSVVALVDKPSVSLVGCLNEKTYIGVYADTTGPPTLAPTSTTSTSPPPTTTSSPLLQRPRDGSANPAVADTPRGGGPTPTIFSGSATNPWWWVSVATCWWCTPAVSAWCVRLGAARGRPAAAMSRWRNGGGRLWAARYSTLPSG